MKTLNKLRVPIIQGGMGVGISLGGLAGAVAKNGAMGVISTADIGFREEDFWTNTEAADERALIKEIKKAKKIAGGNGLVAINAMVATTNFAQMVKVACDNDIDAIISGAGLPLELPELVKGKDVLIAPIVSSRKAAKVICKLWEKRYNRTPDFIVVEGVNAGGHLGFSHEEAAEGKADSLDNILTEVIDQVGAVPVFAGGSVFDKADLERVLALGARGAQIGTRFIVTEECDATQKYKDVILSASKEDVAIIKSPVGMPGRALNTPLAGSSVGRCIRCIHTCNPATSPYCITKALIAAYYGNYEDGLFFCGSNVGRVNEMTTVSKLIEEITK